MDVAAPRENYTMDLYRRRPIPWGDMPGDGSRSKDDPPHMISLLEDDFVIGNVEGTTEGGGAPSSGGAREVQPRLKAPQRQIYCGTSPAFLEA